MASHIVSGDQYRTIDRRMREIMRMVDQKNGSPLDPEVVAKQLQRIIDQPSIIDCSVQPTIPEGWSIHEEDQIASRFTGSFVWDPAKVALYLDDAQKTGKIVGHDLLKKLEGQPVLPTNVGDYLFAHPALIPSDWRGKCVFFWTIYRDSDGNACVRFLDWDGGSWFWGFRFLDDGRFYRLPSAVLAG